MNWREVANRDDVVGGEIETQEGEFVFRGPIASVEVRDDGLVYFQVAWAAQKPISMEGGWVKHETTSFVASADVSVEDIGEGKLHFRTSFAESGTIFLKGSGNKLDPRRVRGLRVCKSHKRHAKAS
ncbi:MAG: hypothetical protein HYT15_04960 [Candidatus Magasanikbacteria bacterium]|nr:hypothetical protein [Candidatus Magasanikbacteria bacterium]